MKSIKIDIERKTITVTRKFNEKASDPNTAEYRTLHHLTETNPSFEVIVHTIKKNPSAEHYKGLNYDYMRDYIINRFGGEERAKALWDLNYQIELTKCHSRRFPVVRKWFLATYPEIKEDFGKVMTKSEESNTVEVDFSEVA